MGHLVQLVAEKRKTSTQFGGDGNISTTIGTTRDIVASKLGIGSGKQYEKEKYYYFVVDSFPLPVCKFGRVHYCCSFRKDGANYGRCPSKKRNLFRNPFRIPHICFFARYVLHVPCVYDQQSNISANASSSTS